MTNDSRPRIQYKLPSGEVVPIIFDHGEAYPGQVTFQLKTGQVVYAKRVGTSTGRYPCNGRVNGRLNCDCYTEANCPLPSEHT